MTFNRSRGQALTEFVIIIPIAFIVLSAPLGFRTGLSNRLSGERGTLDQKLTQFSESFSKNNLGLKLAGCFGPTIARGVDTLSIQWPENIDRQRALSLATLRFACLAEGTSRLGPKAALPLWTAHVSATTEVVAKAIGTTLCPQTVRRSEQLRLVVLNRDRLQIPQNAHLVRELLASSVRTCLNLAN